MFKELHIEKIGNLLIYLAQKIADPYKTKILKLLYIIDETSVKETGVPVTWLEYKAWKYGPVAEDIFESIGNTEKSPFSDFIYAEKVCSNTNQIKAKKDFDDGEFDLYEMKLINRILDEYGHFSASELVALLHKEDSFWHKEVSNHQLDLSFQLQNDRSNHVLELTQLLANDPIKQFAYKSAFDSLEFQQSLRKN
ncbi:MAG: DUF4065 domain-containing protein [Bacteroidetes bacterium]|nr:MAG: DUF4065 domain-containing protein [Bacteroidota bacterium]